VVQCYILTKNLENKAKQNDCLPKNQKVRRMTRQERASSLSAEPTASDHDMLTWYVTLCCGVWLFSWTVGEGDETAPSPLLLLLLLVLLDDASAIGLPNLKKR
jgi:hypothetical protein